MIHGRGFNNDALWGMNLMTILQAPTDTQKRLYDAFTHCVTALELPLNKITVTKVTKIAGLSRRTFYTHFLDIYDLYEKLKQHLAQVLAIGTAGFVTKNGITKPAGILKAIHDIDQYEPYIFAVSNLDTEFFPQQITDLVQQKLLDYVAHRPDKKSVVSEHETYYHILFISYGLGQECYYWMADRQRIPAQDLAKNIYYQLSSVSVGMIDPDLLDQAVAKLNTFDAN